MGLDCCRAEVLPLEEQFAIQQKKFNKINRVENPGFYAVGTDRSKYQVWQPGWTGGAMSSYPLMKLGGTLEWERGMKTLSFLFSTQRESGFFPGVIDAQGKTYGDGFDTPGTERWHLIRKSADVLYFLFKHFDLMEERNTTIPETFRTGAKKTADGFVRLWQKYGQFGQFVDVETGELRVDGSTCAAIAPAALAKAFLFFGEPVYLQTAQESAQAYLQRDLRRGYTMGAPGEILQCPDSESAFGLLESFVILYETTGEHKWLQAASACTHYCASWVTAYNYRFPEQSEFARLGIKTTGSVFANAQNKHSAPAVCTLSGDSLVKLWEWTGNPLYREPAEDVVLTPGQYLSTGDRPIYDWDLTPEERETGDLSVLARHCLPEGFMCERVNLSDWEGEACIGGVFNGSCWCETSNLLAIAEAAPRIKKQKAK